MKRKRPDLHPDVFVVFRLDFGYGADVVGVKWRYIR